MIGFTTLGHTMVACLMGTAMTGMALYDTGGIRRVYPIEYPHYTQSIYPLSIHYIIYILLYIIIYLYITIIYIYIFSIYIYIVLLSIVYVYIIIIKDYIIPLHIIKMTHINCWACHFDQPEVLSRAGHRARQPTVR